MNKELIITKEDIELLKEMKENCLKSSVYDDEKRLSKANAITKFLNLLDTSKKQKEVIDKVKKHCEIEINASNHYLQNHSSQQELCHKVAHQRILDILKEVSE